LTLRQHHHASARKVFDPANRPSANDAEKPFDSDMLAGHSALRDDVPRVATFCFTHNQTNLNRLKITPESVASTDTTNMIRLLPKVIFDGWFYS
jgi:hypothetical protein